MSLDLRNFVNININYNTELISAAERGIVTLITKSTVYTDDPYEDMVFHSLSEFEKAKEEASSSAVQNDVSLDIYVKAFFANGGKAMEIRGGYSAGSVSSFIISVLEKLDYRHVIIISDANEQDLRAAASQTSSTPIVPSALTGETTVSTFSGLNEKMFIASQEDRSGHLYDALAEAVEFEANTYYSFNATTKQYELLQSRPEDWETGYSNYYKIAAQELQNYVIKIGGKGIEALAAAYLSKVRLTDSSTVQDYAFTIEDMSLFPGSVIKDNQVGVDLIEAHFNFDSHLVNADRNYPGDTIHGEDMMNYYLKILLTQDLTEAVMNLLASKIRFNQTGVNRVSNAISQAMTVYIDNGYLDTEYIWNKDDLFYSYNGVEYLVCARNTPLVKGYRCVILPLTSLTPAQREAHVLPPIYMLFADQTGIRSILINGDIY